MREGRRNPIPSAWPRQYDWHTSPLLSCMFNFALPCPPLPSLLPCGCGLRPISPAKYQERRRPNLESTGWGP